MTGRYNVTHPIVANPAPSRVRQRDCELAALKREAIDRGWYQCGDVSSYTTKEHPFAGRYDEYSGTRSGSGEPRATPASASALRFRRAPCLTARLYQLSNEPDTTFAYQEGDLLDDRGDVVVNLYKAVNDRAGWMLGRWNLGAYSGRTLWLYFGVHGDGDPNLSTQQFIDDVLLAGGNEPAPSPSSSAAPRLRAASSRT